MKLKTKLIIAFLTIVIVPTGLFYMALILLTSYQTKSIEKTYHISDVDDVFYGNSIQIFDRMTQAARTTIKTTIENTPDKLQDQSYLEQLNEDLGRRHSYLIVRRDGEIIYCGEEKLPEGLSDLLPSFGVYNDVSHESISSYVGGEIQSLIKEMDFRFSDGSKGSAFIVTPVSQLLPELKNMVYEMGFTIVLILILTSLIMVAWLYRSILLPIQELQKATKEIKEGNLDFALAVTEHDEIGELCQNFEEMRERLKINAEEKVEYDRESKELISNISHDLKTPVTAIKGYVEGIMDGVASSPERLDKYIRTIYNKANDMDKLIDELTFYSKIDTNKIPYTFSKISVEEYFHDCVEEVSLDLESKGIELGYFNYLEEDVTVIADAEQLKRVIHNIITNSVKYLDKKKGIINLRIRDAGDFIQVEIEDNGKGIATRDLPYIFDRFYRTDSSRNSAQGGSGIGLSIVRKIIEDHGGKIWATSKEGTGTVMHFVLRKYQEVPYE